MSSHPVQEELGRHPGEEASSNDAGLHSEVADDKEDADQSPISHTVASIRQRNGTQWIFYYNAQSIISYQRNPPSHGSGIIRQLSINGSPVVGGPNDAIAAALADDSPRVYYIDRHFILREAALLGTSGDNWALGGLSRQNWGLYVNSGLAAFGRENGHLPTGVVLRVLFHETQTFPRWTAADAGERGWVKTVIPL